MDRNVIANMKKQMTPDQEMIDRLMERINEIPEKEYSKNRYSGVRKLVIAASILILVLSLAWISPMGKVVAKKIKSWMQPKNTTQQIEGTSEAVTLTPQYEEKPYEEISYTIYVDEEYFTSDYTKKGQTIKSLYSDSAKMEVTHQENTDIENCMQKIIQEKQLSAYEEEEPLSIEQQNRGIWYSDGVQWDAIISRIYCIDDGKQGCYIVTYQNTIEEDEGYGSRFKTMLNTFQLIEEDKD